MRFLVDLLVSIVYSVLLQLHEQSMNHISLNRCYAKETYCAGYIEATTRPIYFHQLCWGDLYNLNMYINAGVWQDRDERGNPSQKHDVELVKDIKRCACVL